MATSFMDRVLGSKDAPYTGEQTGAAQNLMGISGQLQQQSGQIFGTGQQLLDPILSGRLPAGAQAGVDIQTQDAINNLKARYGGLGLTGSTMEADALSRVAQQKSALQFQIAQQMAEEALKALGISGDEARGAAGATSSAAGIYANLAKQQLESDQELTKAIATFAGQFGAGLVTGNLDLKKMFSGFGGGGDVLAQTGGAGLPRAPASEGGLWEAAS